MTEYVRLNKRKLEQLIRMTPDRAESMLKGAATEIVGDIVKSFGSGEKKGAPGRDERGRYTKGVVTHERSKPGDPPNVDTGALRASMKWTQAEKFRIYIHDGVEYGAYLEIGTDNMEPRPFINPVFENWRQNKFVRFAQNFRIFQDGGSGAGGSVPSGQTTTDGE